MQLPPKLHSIARSSQLSSGEESCGVTLFLNIRWLTCREGWASLTGGLEL